MNAYTEGLVQLLTGHRNAEHALPMKRYMRDQFEFLGIKTPQREALFKQYVKEKGLPSDEQLVDVIAGLWNLPEREFQYAALELMGKMKKRLDPDHMPLIERLIVNKSWWDTVDGVAPNIVAYLFQHYPDLITKYAEAWADSDNMWLRRSAILFQLKYKQKTDEKLLFDYILRSAASDEFFIQKAIGWALREYSKTNPQAVRQFIGEYELKPLSRREGMKVILKG